MKKNIYIYHKGERDRSYLETVFFVPYIYGLLRSYAEQDQEIDEHYDWPLPVFSGDNLNKHLELIVEPEIVGFSCYMWNWNRCLALSKRVKEKYPNCIIVFGGPQAPMGDLQFFEKYPWVDFMIHQEGEHKFYQLLKEIILPASQRNYLKIDGISINDERKIIKTKSAERLDLGSFPKSPLALGYFDEYVKTLKTLNLKPALHFETNRGCPYTCSFCDWGSNIASKVRQFTLERLNEEIQKACQDAYDFIYITDANFGMFSRDIELTKSWIAGREKYGFPYQLHANMAKNSTDRVFEVGELIKNNFPGIYKSTLSFQSMNAVTLENINRSNVGKDNYLKLHHKSLQQKINTYSELIMGLPGDTYQSWTEGLCKLIDYQVSEICAYPFVVLPNAPVSLNGDIEKFNLEVVRISRKVEGFTLDQQKYFEDVDMVVSANTYSFKEYVKMNVFFEVFYNLHFNYLTRVLQLLLKTQYDVSTEVFYVKFFDYFYNLPESLIGKAIHNVKNKLAAEPRFIYSRSIIAESFDNKAMYMLIFFQMTFAIHYDEFLNEVVLFIEEELKIKTDETIKDCLEFQRFYVYQPLHTKFEVQNTSSFDWPELIETNRLIKRDVTWKTSKLWHTPERRNEVDFFIDLKTNSKFKNLLKDRIPAVNKLIEVKASATG